MRCDSRTRTTRLAIEKLENRALLSANGWLQDAMPASGVLRGDANFDGEFNSTDLVQVFQEGKFETSQAADWSTGDWNLDGRFDSQDLVAAFQQGAYADAAAAHPQALPFKGSIQAVETSVAEFPTLFVDAIGSGTATRLGRFSVTYHFEVDLLALVGSGTAHFIAANGDRLDTNVVGQGTDPAVNPISTIVETHTITGGTGRFAGATGSFTLNRVLNTQTGDTSGSFEGTISL